jgi:DNA-binding transcriptional LysR family regulator
MSSKTLDLDTLRTLAVAQDLGGYGQAAARLGRTPSAVSLQMKRLQDAIGAPLFRKEGRGVALTEAGEIVLRMGREMLALNDELLDTIRGASLTGTVRLGFSQDFAETVLPLVLSRFVKLYPLVLIEVRIEGNTALVDAVANGQLDLALAIGHADAPTAQMLGECELVWIAGNAFAFRADQPLPLTLLGPQCAFRKEALRKLDEAHVPWRIAAVSPSVAGIWASARAGLGVTARSLLGLPADLLSESEMFGLPRLDTFPITLHSRAESTNACVEVLRNLVSEVVAETTSGTVRTSNGRE